MRVHDDAIIFVKFLVVKVTFEQLLFDVVTVFDKLSSVLVMHAQ